MAPEPRNPPEPRAYSVQTLVELVAQGRLRIPSWQRLFKWKANHIGALLDSIQRGYPVGTLLLWMRPDPAPAGRVEIGPHRFDAVESKEALWVVDGQQRVTTVVGVLLRRGAPDRPPDDRGLFTWAFDLIEEAWVNPKPGDAWRNHWLPADRLVDATDLLTWLFARKDVLTPAQQNRANALARDVREFQVPAIVVRADNDEALRVIFDRTNNAGVRLTTDETFDALQGSLVAEHPSTIRELARVPIDLGFGPLGEKWLLRLLVQVSGGDMTRVSLDTVRTRKLAEHLPRSAEALRQAIVFMRRDAGIANVALLPYRLPLIVLSAFFARHPEARPRSRDLLARWVWRGAVSAAHRGASVPEIRKMFAAIDADEEGSVQALLKQVGDPRFVGLSRLDTRTAATRLELLGLLSLAPRHLETGELLDGPGLLLQGRSSALRSLGSDTGERTLASRILHPPGESDLARLLAQGDESLAASHGVTPEAQELLRAQRYDESFAVRKRDLEAILSRFLGARMRLGEPDRPSIDALVVAEGP